MDKGKLKRYHQVAFLKVARIRRFRQKRLQRRFQTFDGVRVSCRQLRHFLTVDNKNSETLGK